MVLNHPHKALNFRQRLDETTSFPSLKACNSGIGLGRSLDFFVTCNTGWWLMPLNFQPWYKSPFNLEKKTIMIFITFYCSICFQDFLVKMRFILKLLQWQCVAFSTFRESKELSGSPTIPSFFLVPWAFFERYERNEAVMWSTWNLIGVGLQGFGKWGFQWAFKTKISSNTWLNLVKIRARLWLWSWFSLGVLHHSLIFTYRISREMDTVLKPPENSTKRTWTCPHTEKGKTNLWCLTVQVFRVCLLSWEPKGTPPMPPPPRNKGLIRPN